MKVVSLFAGIGGFDLALTRAGHQIVYANEWDKLAADIYEQHFKHKPDTRDIRTVLPEDIPDHDILCGGFPCPDFSIAGKRAGFTGRQGDLFFEVLRILKAKRTSYFILENVRGLLNHGKGETFKTILYELGELGYELQWFLLDSQNFGVPQQRKRIFIIGNLRGKSAPEIFNFGQSNSRHDTSQSEMEPRGLCLTTRTGARQDPTAETFIGYCLNTKTRGVGQIWNETHIAGVNPVGEGENARFPRRLDRIRDKQLGNAVTVNVVQAIAERFVS